MKIELDLDQMMGFEYDGDGEPVGQKDFRREVVAVAAAQLLDELRADAKNEVRVQVAEVVADEVRAIVAKAMEGPIQKRTSWGEKVGEPQTILEMVRTSIEAFLSGTTSGSDRYGTRKPANLHQLIEEVTREVLSTELRQDIAAAKKQINDEITNRALKAAVAALAPAVR